MVKSNQVILDLDNIFHWKDEELCFKGQYTQAKYHDTKQPIQWPRIKPTEQYRFENWIAAVTNPMDDNRPYPSGNGTGKPQSDGEGPKRVITSIVRIKRQDNSEYLYSYGHIIGYNSFGDEVKTPCDKPEQWTRVKFGYKASYEIDKQGNPVPKRVNTGPNAQQFVFSLPFTKDNLDKLISFRRDDNIGFTIELENKKKVQVRNEKTLDETTKLFMEDFEYLFNANYLSISEKEEIRVRAMNEGLIKRETMEEMRTNLYAQQNLSDKQKQVSYQ